jgi:NAD(P)-dependent dehydrogenase (short-subunit alcohol dehydrogenase family)
MTERRVAVVTGASRGAGKGIALGLAELGMTVYVSGRSATESTTRLLGETLPGTLEETVTEIDSRGGQGIAVVCDHTDDAQTQRLFEQVSAEHGRLDLLVNNAAYIHEELINPGGFWEKPLDLVRILDVGLRSAYVASYHAAAIMAKQRAGLITFTSSFGGACYMHGPAYGAQKAGCDKLAADMAVDLEDYAVAAVSLWLGPQRTERIEIVARHRAGQYDDFIAQAETPEFTGRVIHALASDPQLMDHSGRTLVIAELAQQYGISDEGGRQPPSYRDTLGEPRIPHPARII